MRVLVYSRTRLFAESLAGSLSLHPDIDAVAWYCELDEVRGAIRTDAPSVVVVDLSFAGSWAEVRQLSAQDGAPLVLALAVEDTPDDLVRCAQAGCAGVIPYDSTIERTVALLLQAQHGELRCSPAAAASLMRAVSRGAAPGALAAAPPDCLTRREGEICGLVCDGLSNKEIARALNCSEGTVKNHVHSILSKIGVSRRSALPRLMVAAAAQPPRDLPTGR